MWEFHFARFFPHQLMIVEKKWIFFPHQVQVDVENWCGKILMWKIRHYLDLKKKYAYGCERQS